MAATKIPAELYEQAQKIKVQCVNVAAALSAEAERTRWLERGITFLSNALGVVALLTISVIPLSGYISAAVKDGITIAAAVVLVGGPYLQIALLPDPPSRFRDFAKYVGGWGDTIDQDLLDTKAPNQYETLLATLRLAQKNLNDVRVEWPVLFRRATGSLAT